MLYALSVLFFKKKKDKIAVYFNCRKTYSLTQLLGVFYSVQLLQCAAISSAKMDFQLSKQKKLVTRCAMVDNHPPLLYIAKEIW